MSEDEEEFQQGDAGASMTKPVQAGNIKKGQYAMLQGFPCKVVEMSTSKAGKHGHAKATIIGIDIFTNKKYEDSCPSTHNMEAPEVKKNEYQLIDIQEDGFVTLLLDDGTTKEDLKLPEGEDEAEVMNKLKADFAAEKSLLVTVISAMGKEKIIAYRETGGD